MIKQEYYMKEDQYMAIKNMMKGDKFIQMEMFMKETFLRMLKKEMVYLLL